VVALASAFVRLRPQTDKGEFQREATKAGNEAGDKYADGFYRGADGKLRAANGKFATAAQKAAAEAGGKAGGQYADGFYRDAAGKLRRANGQFANDAEKAAHGMGTKSGQNFGNGFGKGLGGLKGQIRDALGSATALFVPLGLAAAVGQIATIGMAYEDNLNILQAVTKATGDEMARVSEKARELGADVTLPGVSAAGAAAAMNELAKAGFTVEQAMDAAQGTLQLARVAGIDEAEASTIAAAAVNAFGLAAKDTNFVVDELAAAANSSSLEVTDAAMSFKMAGAVFSSFQGAAVGPKEAITELNTAIAILGNNGIRGSDAGTSLKQMLLQLSGPTEQAKDQMALLAQRAAGANIPLELQTEVLRGSKKVRGEALEQIRKLNPALGDMGDIAYDASGRMRPLRDIIGLVAKGTAGMTQEERDYAITQIFGADASRAVIALMKGGLPVYDAMRKAIMEQGAAAEFAAAKNAGLRGALDNVKSQLENAAISVYNVIKGPLTTALNDFARALPGIFENLGKFFTLLYDNRAIILGVAYAIGVLTLAVKANAAASAVMAAGGLIQFFLQYAKATKVAAAGQALLNLAQAASPIGIIVVAIGALVAAFVLAYRNSETFRKIVQGALNGIKVAAMAVADWFMNTLLPILKAVWNGIATGATWLWQNVLRPVFSALVGFLLNYVIPYIRFLWENVFRPVFGFIGNLLQTWWAGVKIIFGFLVGYFKTVVFPVVMFLWDYVFKPVFTAIGKVVEVAWYIIKIAFAAFVAYLKAIVFPVVLWLWNNVFKPVFGFIGKMIQTWWQVVKAAFTIVKNAFVDLGNRIKAVWETFIRPALKAIGDFINSKVVPAFRTGTDAIGKAWDKVKEAARKPVAFVVNQVINPFINGLNTVGKAVGLKDKIEPIKGFAAGGQIPGMPVKDRDNMLASITGSGAPISVGSGEFITNTRSTLANLGLVKAINAKRGKVTHADVDPYLDGGDGRGTGDGLGDFFSGLKGTAAKAIDVISNPKKALIDTVTNLMRRLPGAGFLADLVGSSIRRLMSAAGNFLGGAGGLGGQSVLGGWKGMQRLIAARFPGLNLISGLRPGATTLSGKRSYHADGRAVDYPPSRALTAWIRASFGSKTKELISPFNDLNLLNGKPHRYTGAVWNQHNFAGGNAHTHWAAALGGLIGKMGVKRFDSGGAWPSGTIGVNTSGRTEYVDPNRKGASLADLVDLLEDILAQLGRLGVDVAAALQSSTSRAGATARGLGTTRRA